MINQRFAAFFLFTATCSMLSGCVGLFAVGAGAGVASAKDPRSLGTQLDDENIESRALSRIRDRDEITTQSSIEVVSYNRIVLVIGQTPNKGYKTEIGEIVANVPNVRKVYNEVRVGPPSTTMDGASDSSITAKVKSSLLTESGFPSGKVKVVTESGIVYLMGLVSRTDADKAADIARTVSGVQKVIQLFEIAEG